MKKLFLILILFFPSICFAKSGVLDRDTFWVNSQKTDTIHLTIPSNSNTTAYFHYYDLFNINANDSYGPYLFFSVVSNKKIDIKRTNSAGSSCTNSCFSNDVYLLMTDNTAGAYGYIFYFNARKYQDTIGTQYIEYQIDDNFKFYNKESGSADVYIYGVYANDINEIPNYINNANTTTMLIEQENKNTQSIIDNIQSDCNNLQPNNLASGSQSGITYVVNEDKSITLNGTNSSGVPIYLRISDNYTLPAGTYTLSNNNSSVGDNTAYFYDDNNNFTRGNIITKTFTSSITMKPYIRIGANATFNNFKIYPMVVLGKKNLPYCAYGSKTNKIDETKESINEATNAINDVNTSIKDSNIDNPNSDFSDMEDMIAENGVITNLLSLPITLYSKILNSVNDTCSSYNLGTLFGTSITFSCISLQTLLGNTIWGVIDILFSGFTIYAIAKKMIIVFNSMSSLKEGDVIDD